MKATFPKDIMIALKRVITKSYDMVLLFFIIFKGRSKSKMAVLVGTIITYILSWLAEAILSWFSGVYDTMFWNRICNRN